MQSKDIQVVERRTLQKVREELFRQVKDRIVMEDNANEQQYEINLRNALVIALNEVCGEENGRYEVAIEALAEDEDYQSFASSIKSFRKEDLGAVEAYFLNPTQYGTVNVVISKIIIGVIVVAAVNAIAAAGIAGAAFISGVAVQYLVLSVMTTFMQRYGGQEHKDLVRSAHLDAIDKPMMVAIRPFAILLNKCADIIGEQILNGKVEKVDEVVQKVIALDPKRYIGKPPNEIAENAQFYVCGEMIDARKFAHAQQGKQDVKISTEEVERGIKHLLESYPLVDVNNALVDKEKFNQEIQKLAVLQCQIEDQHKKSLNSPGKTI